MNTFILIVLGQIVSLFGNAALRFALPLYLLRQTGSAALYGGITALAMLPALAGMLTGGALADRCRKARLMALLDLVTAGIAAAAAAGVFGTLFSSAAEAAINWDDTYNVIVIGAGGAGLSAAVSAKEAGCKKVVVLEKMMFAGGNTIRAGGGSFGT